MHILIAAVLSVTWSDLNAPEFMFWPGEEAILCDVARRDIGPRDSTIVSHCGYEPWMDEYFDSGEGPWLNGY